MLDLALGNKNIVEAIKSLDEHTARFQNEIIYHQRQCKHERTAECEHKKLWGDILPPMKVCLECGLSEQGWGSGYLILKATPEEMLDRDDLYKLRVGAYIRDEDKGPIMRREITLEEAIEKRVLKLPI